MATKHIRKEHNVNLLLYHAVFPAKYRRKVFTKDNEQTLKNICLEMEEYYELHFVEIGTDEDHVHFLVQSVPIYSPTKIVIIIKSITARKMFEKHPEIKTQLWGGKFWTSGYYINTVGKHGNEDIIQKYVQNQGKNYKKLYRTDLSQQLSLF
ncbi:MAG: IS200/IS605 family transposase [Patescibacteria group bacterium]